MNWEKLYIFEPFQKLWFIFNYDLSKKIRSFEKKNKNILDQPSRGGQK